MLALILNHSLELIADYPRPVPAPGDALIRVRLSGVCGTDLEMAGGYKNGFSGVLGHEFVGEVVAVGDPRADDPSWVGRRVVGEINIGCGRCDFCRQGLQSQCRTRQAIGIVDRDGCHAEYLTLPIANLHAVPENVPDEEAVFCEPLAAALQVTQLAPIRPASTVVVLGDGKLGLLAVQAVALTGATVHLVGHHAERLALAASWGVAIGRPRKPADVVVDCTGNPAGFGDALDLLRPRGTLVLKSTYSGVGEFDLTRVVVDEITVIGSRCGPFRPAVQLLQRHAIDVGSLITARYPLVEAPAAIEHAGRNGNLKILIQP